MGIGAVSSSEGEFNESGEDENSESSSSSQISSGAHEVDFADLFLLNVIYRNLAANKEYRK